MRAKTRALILAASLLATTAMPVPAAAAPAIDPLSSVPKYIVVNADTGAIMSIRPAPSRLPRPVTAPTIVNEHICLSLAAVCFYSGAVPWADQSFWGTPGTITGTWPERKGGYSGGYTATFKWTGNTPKKSLKVGPDTGFGFASGGGDPVRVTGKSVRIH